MNPQVQMGTAFGRHHDLINYSLIRPSEVPSSTVIFMCPGGGYSLDKPLLYYSTMLLLQKRMDVVHIQYDYKEKLEYGRLSREEQSDWMYQDVNGVVNQVLSEHSYENVMFLGKSVGTMPIANGLCQDPRFSAAKVILLTPIINNQRLAANLLRCKQEMLIVLGTKDHFYHQGNLEAIRTQKPNIRLSIMAEANHALEIGWDVEGSLDVLHQAMAQIDEFIGGTSSEQSPGW